MNLSIFNTANLFEAATDLFRQLGIKLNSNYSDALKIEDVLKGQRLNTPVYKTIGKTFFIGIIDDSVFKQPGMFDNYSYKDALQQADKSYDGLMLFALELSVHPNRSEISELTTAFNRISQKMPVALVLKYPMENENTISISISERFKYKQNWRQGEKAGKVIILRNIKTQHTHAGHHRILLDLVKPVGVTNYAQLHEHWLQVLDVSVLNKKFYEEIFNWYLWASRFVKFPQIRPEKDLVKEDVHQSESLIRLLTRLLFCWFMKEKGLINENLFKKESVLNILKNLDENDSTFYKAILQNLFFATLNKPIEDRKIWNKKEYGDPLVYRYEELFQHPEKLLSYFENIPFLNGGLFDCLDQKKDKNHDTEIRLDGFSTKAHKQPVVPNKLFFGSYDNVNLSKEYDDKKKTNLKIRGIIDLLSNYKFTIEESTPVEEEIALDPELLGRVFENLLASYNPETKTTARKQTGSFYTPPPIVNYMVDESLLEYLKQKLNDASKENDLRNLIGYTDEKFEFTDAQKQTLIKAINDCRILDPACGSGAFPMGMLQRMIHILKKLDPENKVWLNMVVANFPEYMQHEMRKKLEVENWDYVRKIGIIQECIYGVDIQPIATQISKLRFFISLLVDQKEKPNKPNRGFDPLPNLDFKLVTANTLIAPPETDEVTTGMFAGSEDAFYKEFEKLTARYFSIYKHDEKKKVREEIEKLISNKCSEKIKQIENLIKSPDEKTRKALQEKYKDRIANKENEIALWESYKNLFKQEAVRFFDVQYFFPNVKDGFDVVIGNPPYIEFKKLPAEEKAKFTNYVSAKGKYDIYVIFDERTNSLLKLDGVLCFIQPTTFMKKDFGEGIRKFIKQNFKIKTILDFGDIQVFEGATNYTGVFLFSKSKLPKDYKFECHQYLNTGKSTISVVDFQNSLTDNTTSPIKQFLKIEDVELEKSEWNFQNDSTNTLLAKLSIDTKPLSEITESIFQGIASGKDEVFYVNDDTIRDCKIEKGILRKLLKGKDIKKYVIDWAGYYVIYPYDKNSQALSEATLKNDYPNAFAYLKSCKELLKGRDYFDNSQKKWFELWNHRSYENFKVNRIISPEITDRNNFVLSNSFYGNTKTYHIIPKEKSTDHYYYLLGLLNSRLLDFIYKKITTPQAGGFYAYKTQFLSKLPIREVAQPKPYAEIVSKILKAKEENPKADTNDLEKQLDKMVYKLYDLTEEEIAVVEKTS